MQIDLYANSSMQLQNFLISCNSPREVLNENSGNYYFRKKYSEVKKKYDILLNRARECIEEQLIFFDYSGDLSISSDISNELLYRFPKKVIIIAREKSGSMKCSIRAQFPIAEVLEKSLVGIEGYGGGHPNACGAVIKVEDWSRFQENLKEELKHVSF